MDYFQGLFLFGGRVDIYSLGVGSDVFVFVLFGGEVELDDVTTHQFWIVFIV